MLILVSINIKPSETSGISEIGWDTLIELNGQIQYWKLTKASRMYNCIFCEITIQSGQDYFKFWKKGFDITNLHVCSNCFEKYKQKYQKLFE